MIISHKNSEGYIHSYIEFNIVNAGGNCRRDGEYLYVKDVWVHPSLNGMSYLPASSATFQMWKDMAQTNFTASGDKTVWGQFFYESA